MSIRELNDLLIERRSLVEKIRNTPAEDVEQYEALTAQVADLDKRSSSIEEKMSADLSKVTTKRTAPTMDNSYTQHPWHLPSDSDTLRSWFRSGSPMERDGDRAILQKRGFNPNSNALEFRAGSIGVGSEGGYTATSSLLNEISRVLKSTAPLLDLARIINTDTGNPLLIPTSDNTSATGKLLSENAENDYTDLVFGQVSVGSYKFSSDVCKVSRELLEDTGVDLATFIGEEMGRRIGRGISPYLTTGTGSSQPQGIVAASGTVAAASATAIGLGDILNLVNAPDAAWLAPGANLGFMCHQNTWNYIRKLVDSTGLPLVGSVQDGAKPMLLGYPVYINNSMDSTIASTKKSLFFGDFNQYLIRQVGGIMVVRSDHRYFEFDQIAYVGYWRGDAKALQTGALKVLLH